MDPFNIQMMPLTISLFAFIFFFNPEQVLCFPTYEAPFIPSEPAVDPRSPLLPPPSPPNSPPVASSPDDLSPSPPDELPPFQPIQYVNFPIPSFWNPTLSAPSPRRMPKPPAPTPAPTPTPTPTPTPSPSQKGPPLIALSRGQILSNTPLSDSLFSRNSKLYHPSSIPSETNNIPEITKICNSTDRPALCVKFLTPLYNSDTLSVLDKAIKATVYQLKLAMAGITNLAKNPTLQSTRQSDFEDCKQSYEDALENLQNAKNAIPNRDIGTINSMLSAAVTDFSDCDDFSNNPFIVKFDDVLRNLVSICLVIASSLK